MANLSVQQLDDRVYEKLRQRAVSRGVSMEEEVRQILHRAVSHPQRLGKLALECFGPRFGEELSLSARHPHEPMDLDA